MTSTEGQTEGLPEPSPQGLEHAPAIGDTDVEPAPGASAAAASSVDQGVLGGFDTTSLVYLGVAVSIGIAPVLVGLVARLIKRSRRKS